MAAKMNHYRTVVNAELTGPKIGSIVQFINAALPQESKMKPTALMLKMVKKMTPAERAAALKATNEAIVKGGGSILLQGTRWQMLAALKAAG